MDCKAIERVFLNKRLFVRRIAQYRHADTFLLSIHLPLSQTSGLWPDELERLGLTLLKKTRVHTDESEAQACELVHRPGKFHVFLWGTMWGWLNNDCNGGTAMIHYIDGPHKNHRAMVCTQRAGYQVFCSCGLTFHTARGHEWDNSQGEKSLCLDLWKGDVYEPLTAGI
jgi:hypothetical protein